MKVWRSKHGFGVSKKNITLQLAYGDCLEGPKRSFLEVQNPGFGGSFLEGSKTGVPGVPKSRVFRGFFGGPKRVVFGGFRVVKIRPKNGVFWDDGHDPKDVGS